ncbi:hypothetical protein LXT21_28800 [Myxococcus sp. K38C18041901]|uniref:hypothetical protein n=1 Tax=Myxococcus guangdongensis TaxID=2906760 RepID=UPI0020A7CAAB|nr:hypothetical protein [Myxococcus guangdongensis]MCP3062792.1 hypothetical protein [Myxococcus guangdongensis]
MSRFLTRARDVACAVARPLRRALRLVFILILVALPIPLAPVVSALLRPFRRNLPAEVLRENEKKKP